MNSIRKFVRVLAKTKKPTGFVTRSLSAQKISPVVETLPLPQLELGEGPHWSSKTSSLYLVDSMNSRVYRYHPETESVYSVKIDSGTVGFVTPVVGSHELLVVGAGLSLLEVKWDGRSDRPQSQRLVVNLEEEPADENRINDGKADHTGRLWFGTMKLKDIAVGRQGSLYSYTKGKGLQRHVRDIGVSNGMTWNDKADIMYYIDSVNRTVDAFDYHSSNGQIGGRRVAFDLEKHGLQKDDLLFYPDGMTIDVEGKLWIAVFNGSRVVQVDPKEGKIVSEVFVPTATVASCAWGGTDLSDLYVTTIRAEGDSNSGKTFRVRGIGARGAPMYEAVV